jgi:hypothetical protein
MARCPMASERKPTLDVQEEMADEARAEFRAEILRGYWDPANDYREKGPTGHGWSPDPYPESGLV